MRRNVWIANDCGYITFRNAKAFFETSVEKYKGKATLWIDRYGYREEADPNHLKALYIEVEKILESEGIKQIRLRASDNQELDLWTDLGFEAKLKTTSGEGTESTILLKSLHKPFSELVKKFRDACKGRCREVLALFGRRWVPKKFRG